MIWVVFPAWNEERVIRPTLVALWQAFRGLDDPYTAILVDDGSTDRTVAEARAAASDSGGEMKLEVISHAFNMGLGAGLRTGIYGVLDRAADDDILVTLDADNTHPPALIPELVRRVRAGADLAIASRYRAGAEVHGVPGYRRALSDVASVLFQSIYPIPGVRDYTCCFRAYRIPLLRRARVVYGDKLCTARGFEAVMDLLLRLAPLGMKVDEMGFKLDYGGRVGQSKMKVVRTIRSTLSLLVQRRIERMRVWTPKHIAGIEAAAKAKGRP